MKPVNDSLGAAWEIVERYTLRAQHREAVAFADAELVRIVRQHRFTIEAQKIVALMKEARK